MKTTDDFHDGTKWLQRTTQSGKYTWTHSGVLWNNLKERCKINGRIQQREPSYIGSENKFKSFDSFVKWHRNQIGYALGYELDSDILRSSAHKVYSEETCLLIPGSLNRFLQSRKKRKSTELPIGIHETKGKLLVRLYFKDDESNARQFLVCESFETSQIEKAKLAYNTALKSAIQLWLIRLENTKRYCVDVRVIEHLKEWEESFASDKEGADFENLSFS